jgi:hypothetical protein
VLKDILNMVNAKLNSVYYGAGAGGAAKF